MKYLRTIVLLVAAFIATSTMAQSTMDVSKFTRLDNDLTARVTKPVKDNDEGKLCALIRVITNLKDIDVRADALGIIKKEQHNGEIWLYVPYGARSLSFSHDGYFPLMYQYTDNIDEGVVYELRLKNYASGEAVAASSNTQMFVLSHNPDDASVFIDGMEMKTENGVFAAMMSKGKHTYKVEAQQYAPQEGEFELGSDVVRLDAKLRPLFGTFDLFTLPAEGFNVSINGKYVGTSPYKSGRLKPGDYRVHIVKEKFYPVDTLIRVREAESKRITCTLTSFSDSLFYNRQLGGRRLSFGITAGYAMPMISASSGGGFTGSAINYGKGNSEENADYKSGAGFTVGLLADLRLYKNLYLMSGVNYNYYKWSNEVSGVLYDQVVSSTASFIYMGDQNFNFKENYTMHSIEIPLLLSYRFVLSKTGSLHINAGGYVTYGFSTKLKLAGSIDTSIRQFMREGNSLGQLIRDDLYMNSIVEANINMYKKQHMLTETYKAGDMGNSDDYIYNAGTPFKHLNYGLKAGITYEIKGMQLGINYKLMLSNMANAKFWESSRIPALLSKGDNNMSGYKFKINTLEIKLGYILRY